MPEFRVIREVDVLKVVHVKYLRGEGTEESPSRLVDEYWSLDGFFLAERDPEA